MAMEQTEKRLAGLARTKARAASRVIRRFRQVEEEKEFQAQELAAAQEAAEIKRKPVETKVSPVKSKKGNS